MFTPLLTRAATLSGGFPAAVAALATGRSERAAKRPDQGLRGTRVLDAAGQPRVVYRGEHGPPDGQFQTRLGSLSFGDAETASLYAECPNDPADSVFAPRVTPVYLNIQRPFVENPDDPFMDFDDIARKLGEESARKLAIMHADSIEMSDSFDAISSEMEVDSVAELLEVRPDSLRTHLSVEAHVLLDDPEAVAMMMQAGYDGAIHGGYCDNHGTTEYRVFHDSQVIPVFGEMPQ